MARPLVRVVRLGRMPYLESWAIQRSVARKLLDAKAGKSSSSSEQPSGPGIQEGNLLKAAKGPVPVWGGSGPPDSVPGGSLLLVEHPAVYTVGIRTHDYPPAEETRLRSLGAEFQRTDRGGLITFHGPGQLVAYPVLDLRRFTPSVRWHVHCLEETVRQTCARLGVATTTSRDTGVWVGNAKIAAIGVHCSRYVTTHGLALNCDTDLSWFAHIVPCGLEGKRVTSLSEQLRRPVTVADVLQPFLHAFSCQFGCDLSQDPQTS